MTRRVIVYKDRDVNGNLYFISQEFNGDRREAARRNPHTIIQVNWNEVVELFNGIDSLFAFKKAVRQAEDLFAYENISLVREKRLPKYKEIWMLIDGKLKLYSN